jgi:hypothetical protein
MNMKKYWLLLIPLLVQNAWADRIIFQQSPELLTMDRPLVGQSIIGMGQWQLRSDNDLSPSVGRFANSKSIVTSPQAKDREVVIANMELPSAERWTANVEFVLEYEVSVDVSDGNALAAVGIGWTGGGIPAHAGISRNRFFIRQRHFGDNFSGFGPAGGFYEPEMQKWYQVRTVWWRDFDDSVPMKTMSVRPVDDPNDPMELVFGQHSVRSSTLPAGDEMDVDRFRFVNIVWLRVQGQSAIRNITLSKRERR